MSNALCREAQEQIERLSEKVPFSGCWIWTGSLVKTGYGQLTFKGKHKSAHKASYEAFNGEVPDGMWVLHKCDVRACVNPNHLYAGTPIDNRRDMLERSDWAHPYAKNTHCQAGHEYTDGSYRIAKDGSRACRVCHREYKRAYRAAAKGDKK